MTDKDDKIEECGCSKKETPQTPTETKEAGHMECPEGQTMKDGKCIKDEAKNEDVKVTPEGVEIAPPEWANALQAQLKSLETQIGVREKPQPTAQVSNFDMDNPTVTLEQVAEKIGKGYLRDHSISIDIPLDFLKSTMYQPTMTKIGLRETYKANYSEMPEKLSTLQEAVTISGTHAGQDMDTDVAIVPGGISFKPVFQYAKYKQIGQGFDRARFFKSTLPANGTQTVGTTPTEASQTLTSVEVVPSTVTGVYLKVSSVEAENSPFDLTQAVVQASAASYDDFVATDMLDTVSAEGTLTPGLFINASSGATVTHTDTASVVFDESAIFFAREYLENQGYLRGGVKPVAFLHPRQFRELLSSTNVTSMATNTLPGIWNQYNIDTFGGCEIVQTNTVQEKDNTTNDSYNAIICVPKHSYGIAVRRNVNVTFHEYGEDNQTRVTTNWRAKTGVIDASSIVRAFSSKV